MIVDLSKIVTGITPECFHLSYPEMLPLFVRYAPGAFSRSQKNGMEVNYVRGHNE
jgi:hypothetical protein